MARRRARRRVVRDPLAPLGPNALNVLLNRLVSGEIMPEKQQIAAERKASAAQAALDAQRAREGAAGLAEILGEIGNNVQADYQGASGAQAAFGKGLSDLLQAGHEADASRAAQILKVAGAPAAQVEQVQARGASAPATSYVLGGQLPADMLNTQGAAFTAAARQLPAYARMQGATQEGAIRAAQRKHETELDTTLNQLLAKVPGLRASAYKDLIGLELQKEAARTNRDYLGIAGDKQALNDRATIADITGIDPATGQPSLDAQVAASKAAAASAKNVGKARQARQKSFSSSRDKTYALAAQLFKGTKIKNPDPLAGFDAKHPAYIVNRVPYDKAFALLNQRYGQPLRALAPKGHKAWWDRQVDAMINGALRYAGFSRPNKTKLNRRRGPD